MEKKILTIKLHRRLVKPVMWLIHVLNLPDNKAVVLCDGFDNEFQHPITGIYWSSDKDIDTTDYYFKEFTLRIQI